SNIVETTFAPDGKIAITLSDDGRLIRWQRNGTIESARTISYHHWAIRDTKVLSRQGATLGVLNGYGIEIRKLPDFQLVKTIELPEDNTDSLSFRALTLSPDAKTIAVGILIEPADEKKKPKVSMRLYDATSGKLIKEF